MLNDLWNKYEEKNGPIELPLFIKLDENEQIKILKECLNNNEEIYECEYFVNNYIEEIE